MSAILLRSLYKSVLLNTHFMRISTKIENFYVTAKKSQKGRHSNCRTRHPAKYEAIQCMHMDCFVLRKDGKRNMPRHWEKYAAIQ